MNITEILDWQSNIECLLIVPPCLSNLLTNSKDVTKDYRIHAARYRYKSLLMKDYEKIKDIKLPHVIQIEPNFGSTILIKCRNNKFVLDSRNSTASIIYSFMSLTFDETKLASLLEII